MTEKVCYCLPIECPNHSKCTERLGQKYDRIAKVDIGRKVKCITLRPISTENEIYGYYKPLSPYDRDSPHRRTPSRARACHWYAIWLWLDDVCR